MNRTNYTCDNCGAELIFNGNMTFKECSYCGNLVALLDNTVIETGAKDIIPFDITAEAAYYTYNARQHVAYNQISNAKKVYIPFYLCKFNFSYLASCREITGVGDDKQIKYYDVFIDGLEDSYFACAFSDIPSEHLFGVKYIDKDRIISFDALDDGDYAVLDGKFANSEKFIDKAANEIGDYYATAGFRNSIYLCNSDCAEYNKDIKVVLVPFYCFDNPKGNLYVLGQRRSNEIRENLPLYKTGAFEIALLLFVCFLTLLFWFSATFFIISLWIIVISLFLKKTKGNNLVHKNIKIKKLRKY